MNIMKLMLAILINQNICSCIQVDSEDSGKDMVDVTLVLKLQQKLKAVEAEKSRLAKKLENLEAKEDESPKEKKLIKDAIRVSKLIIKKNVVSFS